MKILLLCSAYNSLTQHAHVALKALQHSIAVAVATTAETMPAVVEKFQPDLILCPMLTRIVPRSIWESQPCIILHPGIIGDRGVASLDWALLNAEQAWGTTAVEAAEHVDSGPIWATCEFKMRDGSKSSLYRDEVTRAALKSMLDSVERFSSGLFVPAPLDYSAPDVRGRYRPPIKQSERRIDWSSDDVATIVRKIHAADGSPGVLDEILGQRVYLYGAHREGTLIGPPGEIIAQRHGAICRAAVDGAVWITHLKKANPTEDPFKLPAALVLGDRLANVPEVPLSFHTITRSATFRDIWYEESQGVGYVHFGFYNGAMGTDHCQRLAEAVRYARSRPTRVIVLFGGRDFWSNGIHLNLIEAAPDPAEESWRNINAMDDLVLTILSATDHVTIAAMYGSAGAGGLMMALAADRVFARDGIVLNPHYKGMGGLYGSEYWTYTLPKRVGADVARQLTEQCLPISVQQGRQIGMIDDVIIQDNYGVNNFRQFEEQIRRIAARFATEEEVAGLTRLKRAIRVADEERKPLARYRAEELAEMRRNFWGADRSYHVARSAFVRKRPLKSLLLVDPATDDMTGQQVLQSKKGRLAYVTTGWSSTIGNGPVE
ncbi:MAG: hydrogenase maturation protein [Blastocatellia bacterium]|nr:MAG: hydrogenase maturation protein [Blastocatellia bacterium]